MRKVEWASFTFPALNLWNMPKHNEIVKMINEYYYEHYRDLWEKDQAEDEGIPYKATLIFDNETRVIKGRMK